MPSPERITVLLCDDVAAFRALIRHSLDDETGIEVIGEAGDGNDGVAQVSTLRPDVVLLDLSMPDCDGLEAIPLILAASPETSIVALSGFTADRMRAPVLAGGAHAYLEKGVPLTEIVSTIRSVCDPTPA
jgi:DNA-binding NarL/FixJ family response regulator